MIDLHMHSSFSDGSYTPEELIAMAEEKGLYGVSLTDHDTTKGVPDFVRAAEGKSVRVMTGVEISAKFHGGTMHILGYGINPDDRFLQEHLEWIREGRTARNKEILNSLVELGFHITWEEVAGYAGDEVVGRPHFAMALIKHGYVNDKDEAFDKYLGKGKPGYAERRRFDPEDSIKLIHRAGGLAVLAHPFTLNLSSWALRKKLVELADAGLDGMEVYYSEHSPKLQKQYLKMAKDAGLIVTGGSDFHGAVNPDVSMGTGFGSLHVPDDVFDQLETLFTR